MKKPHFLDLIITTALSFGVMFGLTRYVIKPVRIEGSSMYPTYKDGQIGVSVIPSKENIERFDVVIVKTSDGKMIVKRVIGMPGETLSYKDDVLYIDGISAAETFLDKEYVASCSKPFTSDIEPLTLGKDEYYCLGDNRRISRDSRYYGPFQSDDIVSKGVYVLPFGQ